MGCNDGERGPKDAGLDHAVRVAVGSHGDLDQEVMWAEGSRVGDRHSINLIGFVEVHNLTLFVSVCLSI